MEFRWLWDEPADGAWNMALDEALLESAGDEGVATLRFYRWSEPTVSLGYFQRAADRAAHAASRDCPLVRRASGGGAILHDAELTYSLAIPTADRWSAAARELHAAIHSALRDALKSFGVATHIFGCSNSESSVSTCEATIAENHRRADAPFLCFQRRAPGDLLLSEAKIAGSGRRRHRAAVLQHGSVLLARSRLATGVARLGGVDRPANRSAPIRGAILRASLQSLRLDLPKAAIVRPGATGKGSPPG